MRDQADASEFLPFDNVDDVGDVCVEDDLLAHEVRTLAEPGHGRREHFVALALQEVGHAPPTPTTVPGAVNENEGFLRARLCHCLHASHGRYACTQVAPAITPRRVTDDPFDWVMAFSLVSEFQLGDFRRASCPCAAACRNAARHS